MSSDRRRSPPAAGRSRRDRTRDKRVLWAHRRRRPAGTVRSSPPLNSAVVATLRSQRIELPSWAFGNSGTRFKVFAQQGVPRDPYEKIADAAQVNRFTGVAPTVALHIPWDKVDDYADLARHAAGCGVALGTINSNTFQDDDYMLGSVCHPDARVRRKAVDHLLECVDIMDATGSRDLKLWFADGTNYPGQDDIRGRQDRLAESLAKRLRAPRRRPADRPRVQALRAVVLHDGRPGLGHRADPLPGARRQGEGRGRHRPPRARREHRVHRRVAAPARPPRRLRLQLAVLRRRRPDGRRGGPVPALPDHGRGRGRGRAGPVGRRRLHARPVPQHRAEDPRPDPLGDERPGGDGQGARRRPRRARGGPARRRRPRRERRPDGRLQHGRPADARRGPRGARAWTRTRWRPTPGRATRSRS